MIIYSEDGLKYDVQWLIKTIQTSQHVITSDQLNTTGAELGPAQPQIVCHYNVSQRICGMLDCSVWHIRDKTWLGPDETWKGRQK